jgi:hypothetical protein
MVQIQYSLRGSRGVYSRTRLRLHRGSEVNKTDPVGNPRMTANPTGGSRLLSQTN